MQILRGYRCRTFPIRSRNWRWRSLLLLKLPFFQSGLEEHSKAIQERLDALGGVWMKIAFIALLPALCEEFLFRGLVLSGLRRDLGIPTGIVICGALFGVAHQLPLSIVTIGLFGIALAWMAHRSGSIVVTIAAHFLWNSLVVLSSTEGFPAWLGTEGSAPHPAALGCAAVVLVAACVAFARIPSVDTDPAGGDSSAG